MKLNTVPESMKTSIKLLCSLFILSQSLLAQNSFKLSGRVSDKTNAPVPFANLSLKKISDSSVVAFTTADTAGRYSLFCKETVPLVLKTEAFGFKGEAMELGILTDHRVMNIRLNSSISQTLSEVSVVAKKQVYEYKPDRTIFHVENSISASGGNALDALRKTPGVQVMNKQVNIAGKNGAALMINGKLQQLSGDDLNQFLQSIPADNLSKIEVITTPSSKYDAEGNSGLINLVLKKNYRKGLKGSATVAYNRNSYNAPSGNMMLTFRRNKLDLFFNASAGNIAWKYTARANTFYPQQTWYQKVDTRNTNIYGRVQLGGSYTLNKRSSFGFQFSEAANKIDNIETISASSYNVNHQLDSTIMSPGNTKDLFKGKHTLNINYEFKIDTTGKKLTVDADYYGHKGNRNRDFTTATLLPDQSETNRTVNRMTGKPVITIKSIKADVEYPLKAINLSFGVKASEVQNIADNTFHVLKSDIFITDTSRTNTFSYSEKTQAVYLTAQKTIKKFDVQAGLRAEHTSANGISLTAPQSNKARYTMYFPTAHVQYKPHKHHTFGLNFTKRINRPGYAMLNPFKYYYTPTSYIEGNPKLQPSINYLYEANYLFKSKYNFKVFYSHNKNYFDRIIITDTTKGTSNITRANIGDSKYMAININANFEVTSWWDLAGSMNGGLYRFDLYDSGNGTFNGVNGWFDVENSFTLNKKKTISTEVSCYYYSPRQKDIKRWEEMSCINIGIRFLLLNKNLVINLNASDIMAKTYWLQTNLVNGTREQTYDDERGFRISATYKFGNKALKNKREKSLEEIQRVNSQ